MSGIVCDDGRKIEIVPGYIYTGPWQYYQGPDYYERQWPKSEWLVWDGAQWVPFADYYSKEVP